MGLASNRKLRASFLCLALLKMFESFSPTPYNDGLGVMTVGYGHVILPGETFEYPMSHEKGLELLERDVEKHQEIIYKYVDVPLTQSQHDALCSFAFNLGETKFAKTPLLRELNSGNYDIVPHKIGLYVWGVKENGDKIKMRGLQRRRAAEIDLWNGEFNPNKRY